ncbi:MAG: hypothetical protein WAK18_00095 [Nocardioidaceae bacterium]
MADQPAAAADPRQDPQRLEEIALLTRLTIEARGRSGPLTSEEIDQLLAHSPVVLGIDDAEAGPPET